MTPSDRRKPKAGPRRKPRAKTGGAAGTFPQAFAALLRSRKIPVPKGLQSAPPDAYARQPPSFVEQLAELSDDELQRYGEHVAGYAARQAARARSEWEASPLIAELRRRKLPEPPQPTRAAGVSVSLTKPLAEWTDKELIRAAREWSRRAGV